MIHHPTSDTTKVLQHTLTAHASVLRASGQSDIEDILQEWEQMLAHANAPLTLAIIGNIGAGKSTLLNLIIGRMLVKVSVTPYHAINIISTNQAEKIAYRLTYLDEGESIELNENLEQSLSTDSKLYVEGALPIDWGTARLIEYPELVNFSGDAEALALLRQADSLIIVLTCDALLSQSEQQAIDSLLSAVNYASIYVVCNRLDTLAKSERAEFIEYAKNRLLPYTSSEDRIFFTDGRVGMEQLQQNAKYDDTITDFVEAIRHYFSQDESAIRSGRLCNNAGHLLQQMEYSLTNKRNLLNDQINSRLLSEKASTAYTALSKQHKYIQDHIPSIIALNHGIISSKVDKMRSDLFYDMNTWVDEYLGKRDALNAEFLNKGQVSMTKQLENDIINRLGKYIKSWQDGSLAPTTRQLRERLQQDIVEWVTAYESLSQELRLQEIGNDAPSVQIFLAMDNLPILLDISTLSGFSFDTLPDVKNNITGTLTLLIGSAAITSVALLLFQLYLLAAVPIVGVVIFGRKLLNDENQKNAAQLKEKILAEFRSTLVRYIAEYQNQLIKFFDTIGNNLIERLDSSYALIEAEYFQRKERFNLEHTELLSQAERLDAALVAISTMRTTVNSLAQ